MMGIASMTADDWAQARESITEHIQTTYQHPPFWFIYCVMGFVAWAIYKFQIHTSYWCWAAIGILLYTLYKVVRHDTADAALREGYEMGFEAGQLAARGISMENYMAEIKRELDANQ